MSLSELIEKKAKTLPQIEKDFLEFKYEKQGIVSQQEQMDKFNAIEWVRLEDARQEIDDCKASWQNLKDTIQSLTLKYCILKHVYSMIMMMELVKNIVDVQK